MSKFDAAAYAARYPCVRSGYCCKSAPCAFGEVKSPTDRACAFLEVEAEYAPGVFRYRCGRYEWILANVAEEVWRLVTPAFGGGCTSPMFNTDREAVLARIKE